MPVNIPITITTIITKVSPDQIKQPHHQSGKNSEGVWTCPDAAGDTLHPVVQAVRNAVEWHWAARSYGIHGAE